MGATYQPPQWLIPDNANTDKVGNYCFDLDGSLVNKKACDGRQTDSKTGDVIIKIVKYFNIQCKY